MATEREGKCMENEIKIINRVGKSLDVKVNDMDGIIWVTVEFPRDRIRLSSLKAGDIFRMGEEGYIVLEQLGNGAAAVMAGDALDEEMVFDPVCNNWKTSYIRRFLNGGYMGKLTEVFGEGNIISHMVDLRSLDGLKDYGKCTDKVSLLSIRQYWQYREYMGSGLHDVDGDDGSWWLVTPDSTLSGVGGSDMLYVGSMGDIGCASCDFSKGIRPYFVLNDSVLVLPDGHVCIGNGALDL